MIDTSQMTEYEKWRVYLNALQVVAMVIHVIVTMGVPFMIVWYEEKRKKGKK